MLPRVRMTPNRDREGTESACLSEKQHTPGHWKWLDVALFWVCNSDLWLVVGRSHTVHLQCQGKRRSSDTSTAQKRSAAVSSG